MLRRLHRPGKPVSWNIVEKETLDEMIFRTTMPKNRTILEYTARGNMRIGEVLILTPKDVNDQKLAIRNPKSGKDEEMVFIPRKVAECLRDTSRERISNLIGRYFQLTNRGKEGWQKKTGALAGIELRQPDLRRHPAT